MRTFLLFALPLVAACSAAASSDAPFQKAASQQSDAGHDATDDHAAGADAADAHADTAAEAQDDASLDAPDDVVIPDAKTDAPAPDAADAGCSGELVINEVQTAGASSTADEFVEIYNPTSCAVTFAGSLVYRSATGNNDFLLLDLSSTSIPALSFFVVGGPKYKGPKDATFPGGSTGTLGGSGGGVALFDASYIHDSVGWGTAENAFLEPFASKPPYAAAAPAPDAGESIGRLPDGLDTDSSASDFHLCTPTPKAANACP